MLLLVVGCWCLRDRTGKEWNGRTYPWGTKFGPLAETFAVYDHAEVKMPSIYADRISVPEPASKNERLHPTLDKWLWQQCRREVFAGLQDADPYKPALEQQAAWFFASSRADAQRMIGSLRRDISRIEDATAEHVWESQGSYRKPGQQLPYDYSCVCIPGKYPRTSTGKACIVGAHVWTSNPVVVR